MRALLKCVLALALMILVMGKDDPVILKGTRNRATPRGPADERYNEATALEEKGKWAEAYEKHKQAYELYMEMEGWQKAAAIGSLNNMGSMNQQLGKPVRRCVPCLLPHISEGWCSVGVLWRLFPRSLLGAITGKAVSGCLWPDQPPFPKKKHVNALVLCLLLSYDSSFTSSLLCRNLPLPALPRAGRTKSGHITPAISGLQGG